MRKINSYTLAFSVFIAFSYTSLIAAPSSESKPMIGAFYFGVFSETFRTSYDDYISLWPISVQNRPQIWWYGVADLYKKSGPIYQEILKFDPAYDSSHLSPVIGHYDNSQVPIVEKHIDQASDGGLDYFNFYWYWSKSQKHEVLQEALLAFKKAKNKNKLKFHITMYFHPWDPDHNLTANDAVIAVDQIIAHVKDSQYLRINGRPVIAIGDARNNRSGELSDLLQLMGYIRSRFKELNLENPIITLQPGAIDEWSSAPADAFQCLVPSPYLIFGDSDYSAFVGDNPQFFNNVKGLGKSFSPCVASGFDERPRFKVFYENYSDLRFFKNFSFSQFKISLLQAYQATLNQTDPMGKLINIYAWNEWHEGGIIEPNMASGTQYLEIIESTLKTNNLFLKTNSAGRLVATAQSSLIGFSNVKTWKLFSEKKTDQKRKLALYECKITGLPGTDRTFVSTSSDCEGQTSVGSSKPIGYSLNSISGLKHNYTLIYRCNAGQYHYVSEQPDCGKTDGQAVVSEGPLGYVPQ